MLVKKSNIKKEKIATHGVVWDYELQDEKVGLALQELNGRVPDVGWYKNTKCYELCYIISGKGVFYIDDKEYEACPGDVVIIDKNKRSYVVASKLAMITITQPNWYASQCELIED